jgi:predicted transcriptional regulator
LANYVGCQLGKIENSGAPKEELQTKLGKDAKIASTRLGELVKSGIATKTPDEKYSITTFGVVQVQKDILPKIKAKMGN